MPQIPSEVETKYAPKTPRAQDILEKVREYSKLFEAAKVASDALARWSAGFVGIEPGTVIEASKRLNAPCAIFVPSFEIRGTFSGWAGNKQRMRVDAVHITDNHTLSSHPQMQVRLTGVPLKNTDEPFKGARCSVTLDIMEYAMDREPGAETGYPGYFNDALGRYVDHVEGRAQGAKN